MSLQLSGFVEDTVSEMPSRSIQYKHNIPF